MSLVTFADSSDDSSPSNADQSDRQLLNASTEAGLSRPHIVVSNGDGSSAHYGSQTQTVPRRASMPPLSTAGVTTVTIRRSSSPVLGSQHASCRRVYYLSSLAEDPAPLIAPPPTPCFEQLNTSTELDIARLQYSGGQNSICKNGHNDIILMDKNVCLPSSESKHCSVHTDRTFQVLEDDMAPVIYTDDGIRSNGASLNGISVVLPKNAGVRRGSAPAVCSTHLPAASTVRRCSAPMLGAELIAVSLWTSKRPFDAKPSSSAHCLQPSVVLVESPHFNVGVDQLSFLCVLTNNAGSLKVPLEPNAGRSREKRSHSAHAIVINPAQFVKRRYSSPLGAKQHCWNAGSLINLASFS